MSPSTRPAPVATTRLQNGVTVVTAVLPHHVRAHVFVQLRGGPCFEDDKSWGLSHVVEHMVFRGTAQHKDSLAVSLAADDFGGDVGAATYRDRVTFDTRCDVDRVADAVALLGTMLTTPRFEGFTVERGIIEEEMAEYVDDDGTDIDIDNAVFRQLFAGQPLARSIEGTPDTLKSFTRPQLKRFHQRLCTAQNIVVSVAGPVDHNAVVAAVDKHFAHLPAGPRPKAGTAPTLDPDANHNVVVIKDEDPQTEVRLCFRTGGLGHPDAIATSLLVRLLDDGPASRLQHEVIDKRGLAYSVWAMIDDYSGEGLVEIGGQVRHDRVAALVEGIVDEVVRLRDQAPRADELARVLSRTRRDLRDVGFEAGTLAEAIGKGILDGEPFDAVALMTRATAVDPSTLQVVAARLFVAPKLVLRGEPRRRDIARCTKLLERLR